MMRHSIEIALILALLAASPGRADEADVLKAIPTNALGFVLVNRLDKTNEKLTKVAQLVQAPPLPFLMLAKMQAGIQAGVDDSGSAAAVMLPSWARVREPPTSSVPPAAIANVPVLVKVPGV